MDGRLFLGTAHFLQNNGADEAAYRSAISRAYYACFIVLRDLAFSVCGSEYRRREGIRNERNIGHTSLQRYLKNGQVESVEQLGEDLASLYGSRIDADYNMRQTMTEEDARQAVEEAEALLNSLSNIPEEEIKAAVNNYLQTIYGNHEGKQ